MKSLRELSATDIKYIFTDIDDTLTKDGRLEESAYSAIWQLKNSGKEVIPVTGRPAGWCELIARQWPVTAVIGENGGFYFHYSQKQMQRKFVINNEQRLENQNKLQNIKQQVLAEVPGSAVASDQFCRLMDLAIDFCEDVAPLDKVSIQKIVEIFEQQGATAKVSSIHVNGWFGDYDKLSMCQQLCKEVLGFDLETHQQQVAFVGDSPNDEPMFGFFENSVGVANVKDFTLNTPPKFVTDAPQGQGFKEFADHLLRR